MNTEFMLTIPADYIFVFAFILAGMVGALIACVVMLNTYQKRLEAIFERTTMILEDVNVLRDDIRVVTKTIDQMHDLQIETDALVEQTFGAVNAIHHKVDDVLKILVEEILESDMDEYIKKKREEIVDKDEWPEPGEAVVLEERDVAEPSGDKFIDDFLAGKYDEVLKKASETTMSVAEAAATFSEYDVDDLVDKKAEEPCEDVPDGFTNELDIHMISREEYLFGGLHEFSKHKLWYDTVKDVLRQTNGLFNSHEFEPATATFLGDGLRFFGVSSENKNVIYIRNHKLKADFMVEKASVIARNGVEN